MNALNWRLSSLLILTASFILPPTLHAATVSIADHKLDLCGRSHLIFCDGFRAYSLSELERGVVRLPIENDWDHEFVVLNDTGAAVSLLQVTYVGPITYNTDMSCLLEGTGRYFFHTCTVTGDGSRGDGAQTLRGPVNPPVEFTFISAGSQTGIPDGAYFDIKTDGFAHNCFGGGGYLTISGTGTGSGSSSPPSAISQANEELTPDMILRPFEQLGQYF